MTKGVFWFAALLVGAGSWATVEAVKDVPQAVEPEVGRGHNETDRSHQDGDNAFLRAPAVSTVPPGWTGPTWFQLHASPPDGFNSSALDRVPGGPYLVSALRIGESGTAAIVPINPVDGDASITLRAVVEAVGAIGPISQHPYRPILFPQPGSEADPGGKMLMGGAVCHAVAMADGSSGMACVGRADVTDVERESRRLIAGAGLASTPAG